MSEAINDAGDGICEWLEDLVKDMKLKGYEAGNADLKIDLRMPSPFWLSVDNKPYDAPNRRSQYFYGESLSAVFARAQKWISEMPESETAAMAPWFDTAQMSA